MRPNDPRSCQVDGRFQPRLSFGSVFLAKDVRTGRPDTPSEGGRTWAVAGCRNDVARLAHFRSPDKGARHVSSWGIRMELLRIAMRTPCHQGKGSLQLAHADGPPCDARHSSFHTGKNSVRPTFHLLRISHIWNSVRPTFHLPRISHIRNSIRSNMSGFSDRIFHIRCLTPDGRGGCFNFPGQTCPDPLIALTQKASAADNSDSPDSLARQTLAIRRIHFHPQSKSKL
uniref:Uncharacterized protein n=1 Tax=Vitis vinifera TaxID=29760 RepID=A5BIV1_VITVI|nr:hypothetical protein VITISV_028032 [Vitis vinifera]